MKRIHFTRKPPKVKRTINDGSSIKTKYVRMSPVMADNVHLKNKEETISPLSEGSVNDNVFPMQDKGNIT